MKRIAVLTVFAAVLYSGCSDNCKNAEGYCKNDHEYNVCMDEIDNNWDTRSCDSMFENTTEGTACATFDGRSDCVRKCVLGQYPATCSEKFTLTSCRKKIYKDGSEGGVIWDDYCQYGCSDTDGIAKCNEKPSE